MEDPQPNSPAPHSSCRHEVSGTLIHGRQYCKHCGDWKDDWSRVSGVCRGGEALVRGQDGAGAGGPDLPSVYVHPDASEESDWED